MLLPALLVTSALVLGGSPVPVPTGLVPTQTVPGCTPTDDRLAELSGLAVRDGLLLAVGDGGATPQVLELDPTTCSVLGEITAAADPRDVEDLAVGADGTVWLADVGDNDRQRETVALLGLRPGAATASLHRLTYPDGPRDAEALLLERGGRPVLVTKEVSGLAGIYAPDEVVTELAQPGPTALRRVGELALAATGTDGGPLGGLGSILVTGGAVSPDGRTVAVRTYTDAYLFDAPDGDVVEALQRDPVRVALPGEPQGEAVALTTDGDLLSGSESARGALPPLRQVAGATSLLAQGPESPTPAPEPGPVDEDGSSGSGVEAWQAALIAVVVAVVVVWVVGRLRRLAR